MGRLDDMIASGVFKCFFRIRDSVDKTQSSWVADFPDWFKRNGDLYFVVPLDLYKKVGTFVDDFKFHGICMTRHVLLSNSFKDKERVQPIDLITQ